MFSTPPFYRRSIPPTSTDQASLIHWLTLSMEKKNMKSKLFLNTKNEAEDINTSSDGKAIHWQKTNGSPQQASPMQIKSYPHIRRSTNSNKQTERFINRDHPSVQLRIHTFHHHHHHHSSPMPSACTQCSGPHTSTQCPLDLLTIYKLIINSIHHDNPNPNSNKSNNNYAWSDNLEVQLKRNIKPPTLKELTKWFEEPILANHFIDEYNGVWDTKTQEDLICFKEVNHNLQKIQWQIDHLEALRAKENEKAGHIVEDLSWVGFSGQNYEVVKELHKVDFKLSLSNPLPNTSSSARFTPYNKCPTLAQ